VGETATVLPQEGTAVTAAAAAPSKLRLSQRRLWGLLARSRPCLGHSCCHTH
jgi:hypothetical protein